MTTPIIALAVAGLLSGSSTVGGGGYAPSHDRIRAGVQRQGGVRVFEVKRGDSDFLTRVSPLVRQQKDPVWNGLLIGAAVGAAGGYVWAQGICGSNDRECFYIAGPVGVLAGAGIGAAVGAIVDALHR